MPLQNKVNNLRQQQLRTHRHQQTTKSSLLTATANSSRSISTTNSSPQPITTNSLQSIATIQSTTPTTCTNLSSMTTADINYQLVAVDIMCLLFDRQNRLICFCRQQMQTLPLVIDNVLSKKPIPPWEGHSHCRPRRY